MIPFYIRFLIMAAIWAGLFFFIENTARPIYIFSCSLSFAAYFLLAVTERKLILYSLMMLNLPLIAIYLDRSAWPFLLLAALFYLYEAAQSIRPAAFYSLLGGTALLAAFTMIFLRPSVIAVTLAIAALSVGYAACIGLNSARCRLEELRELYDQVLEEYRKAKRVALKNEGAARAEERTRIARDIHDSVGHKLTALGMEMQSMLLKEHNTSIARMKHTVEECLEETRRAVRALKSEAIEGIPAIIQLVRKLESESSLRIRFTTKQGVLSLVLPNIHSIALYRIIQEALTNCLKYSESREVDVILGVSSVGGVSFEIRNAFHSPGPIHESFGLKSIRERVHGAGGTVQIYCDGSQFVIMGSIPVKGDKN
ncbi:MAG: sensor histidine kinase [Bacillota bacterium]